MMRIKKHAQCVKTSTAFNAGHINRRGFFLTMAQKHGLVQKDRENTDWQNDIIPRIAELLEEYIEREGDKPTLRTMYYVALDEGLFPAVFTSYKGLSSAIVTAKKVGVLEKTHSPIIRDLCGQNFVPEIDTSHRRHG